MGFQPGIAAGAPGDANYSPMWRIFMIGWEDPDYCFFAREQKLTLMPTNRQD